MIQSITWLSIIWFLQNIKTKRIGNNSKRRMLPCSFCTKCFDRPSLLNRHLRTHTGERPHACEICNKAFSTSSSLNTHRRIHSGEKPHECGVCGKKFTASSNLYYHRMTHVKVCKVVWNHSYIYWTWYINNDKFIINKYSSQFK